MIIDFHTHIFPKIIKENREKFFINEPAFKMLYDSPKSKIACVEDILAMMDEEGIDRSVVFGFPWQNNDTFKMNNDYIIEAIIKYSDRLTGFSCFDIFHPDSAKEAERCLNSGLSGVGELADYNDSNKNFIDYLKPVMSICKSKQTPVMIHTNEPVGHIYPGKTQNLLSQIYNISKTFPENLIVFAHYGGGIFFYNLLKKEVKDVFKNTFFDTAASPYLYDERIWKFAYEIAGPEKILFGTDYPLIRPSVYFKQINESELSDIQKNNIFSNNAKKILNIV